MKKYNATVTYYVEIELPDDTSLDTDYWLRLIADNIAYHKSSEYGFVTGKEIDIEKL